jgi:hypothetical protein
MQFTTQLIIGLVVATVLIGILITLYVKIFARPSTPSSDGCQAGTTNGLGVGCSSCPYASCASCTADGDCQNGGTCKKFGSGAKGVCVCPKPYSGLKCETQCLSNSDCPNGGKCANGTCDVNTAGFTAANCQAPNCNLSTQTCADGWTTNPKDPSQKKCGVCADGRGPDGDCSMKKIKNFQVSLDNSCMSISNDSQSYLDSTCNQAIAGAYSTGTGCSQASNSVDGCLAGESNVICVVPEALVNPQFQEKGFSPCFNPTSGPTYQWLENQWGFKSNCDSSMPECNLQGPNGTSKINAAAIPRLNKFGSK